MSQRGRKSSNYNDAPAGGNILFTLGLVSVVALLVIGYLMTQGGVKSIDGSAVAKFLVNPTATPAAIPTPTPQPVVSAPTASPAVNNIVQKYEKDIQQQKEAYEKQLKELRDNYETQITDLNTRIQLLEMSNKALRAKSGGN